MNIGAQARRHGTTALLGLAIAGFGTATALAGSAPLPNTPSVTPSLTVVAIDAAKAAPLKAEPRRTVRVRRNARAVPFFAFPPRI